MNKVRYWAVVPAAGIGRRMNVNIPKQYLDVKGKPLMVHTLERLLSFDRLEKIVIVLDSDDEHHKSINLLQHQRILRTLGAKERYQSVLNGLNVLVDIGNPDDWVLVHDVARPCIRHSDLHCLVTRLHDHPVGGLLGSPVTDTIKRARGNDTVSETVNRDELWHAMTPQMFRLGMLHTALSNAIENNMPVTDEASAIEYAGKKPVMVQGHADNIKVTCGSDLALAGLYIEQQLKASEVN